jgi:hypothetical protein|tara:strand:+ start:1958 stop:2476 length:519 start_codon:yes stop_codon:yes gene_type:complete
MTEVKKKGRGRPKGAPNKPVLKLITERTKLQNNADAYEILCQAEIVAQDDADKASNGLKVFAQRNASIKAILNWIHNPLISSTLPEGKTPFKNNDAPASDLAETSLRFEFKLFKYFVTNQLPIAKREAMWIGMLEGIPAQEAEMIDLIKDGKNPFKHITKDIVQKAFPDITI